jgi:hypothetical protein
LFATRDEHPNVAYPSFLVGGVVATSAIASYKWAGESNGQRDYGWPKALAQTARMTLKIKLDGHHVIFN